MSNVMSTLRGAPSKNPHKVTETTENRSEEPIPTSLEDILVNLSQLDLNIEASALVKTNGEIIASAISSCSDLSA